MENCYSFNKFETPKRHPGKWQDFQLPNSHTSTPVLLSQHRPFKRIDQVFFVVNQRTRIVLEFDSDVSRKDRTEEMRTLSVDDIGGLDKQFAVVRDMIRLCLDTPEVFRQQGTLV